MKTAEVIPAGWAPKTWMNNVWLRYGLNYAAWKLLWDRQGGVCAGCEEGFAHPHKKELAWGLKPEVDHRHPVEKQPATSRQCEASAVRGLLCRRCNQLLGELQDNQLVFQNLAAYLKRHGDEVPMMKRVVTEQPPEVAPVVADGSKDAWAAYLAQKQKAQISKLNQRSII